MLMFWCGRTLNKGAKSVQGRLCDWMSFLNWPESLRTAVSPCVGLRVNLVQGKHPRTSCAPISNSLNKESRYSSKGILTQLQPRAGWESWRSQPEDQSDTRRTLPKCWVFRLNQPQPVSNMDSEQFSESSIPMSLENMTMVRTTCGPTLSKGIPGSPLQS